MSCSSSVSSLTGSASLGSSFPGCCLDRRKKKLQLAHGEGRSFCCLRCFACSFRAFIPTLFLHPAAATGWARACRVAQPPGTCKCDREHGASQSKREDFCHTGPKSPQNRAEEQCNSNRDAPQISVGEDGQDRDLQVQQHLGLPVFPGPPPFPVISGRPGLRRCPMTVDKLSDLLRF